MTSPILLGHYDHDKIFNENADLSLDFLVPITFSTYWKRCSIVADFFSNYQSQFDCSSKNQMILSTIVNELVENAMKFSEGSHKHVSISLRQHDSILGIETVNKSTSDHVNNLKAFIERLEKQDIENLFLEQIQSAAISNMDDSGLGLLTLIKDYNAKLGIKLTPSTEKDLFDVFIQVTLKQTN